MNINNQSEFLWIIIFCLSLKVNKDKMHVLSQTFATLTGCCGLTLPESLVSDLHQSLFNQKLQIISSLFIPKVS